MQNGDSLPARLSGVAQRLPALIFAGQDAVRPLIASPALKLRMKGRSSSFRYGAKLGQPAGIADPNLQRFGGA